MRGGEGHHGDPGSPIYANWPTHSSDPRWDAQLAAILQYAETPQYLRRATIPHSPALKLVGLTNPVDAPHHVRAHERVPFREGVVKHAAGRDGVCEADVGISIPCAVSNARGAAEGDRLTVAMDMEALDYGTQGRAVPPSAPRLAGQYWGYSVRTATSLSEALTAGPVPYARIIGTSQNGALVGPAVLAAPAMDAAPSDEGILVVLGGLAGLEAAVAADPALQSIAASELFDCYVNVLPFQGSRTIRTEEAILVAIPALAPLLGRN